jgi:hypothetical protein
MMHASSAATPLNVTLIDVELPDFLRPGTFSGLNTQRRWPCTLHPGEGEADEGQCS